MGHDVVGLGNAIMDALVVAEGDALLDELGLVRGTMHPVDHDEWSNVFERVQHHGVAFESGGSCANTIATLGRLGAAALYCGQVGDDELGKMYTERMLSACGDHALRVTSDGATGKCLSIISAEDAERTMLTDLGASVRLSELGDFREAIAHAKVAHFTGYTLLDGPTLDVVLEAMATAKEAGVKVSLDVADPFVVTAIKERLWRVIDDFADIVFLNADEARALTDHAPEDAAQHVAEHAKVEVVVVKLGSRGSLVHVDGETTVVEVSPVEALDTTGAGDAYAGGFLYGWIQGWGPQASGDLASAVAAVTVGQIGAVVKDANVLRTLAGRIEPSAA